MVISLGQQLVLWCIIETQDSDVSFLVLFTVIEHKSYSVCYKRACVKCLESS